MRSLIICLVFTALLSAPVVFASSPLDGWAIQKQDELFQSCSVTSKQWFSRYRDTEVQWQEKLADLGELTASTRAKNLEFFKFAKIVFPQALPSDFPLKGAYLLCFEAFVTLKAAKTRAQFDEAFDDFKACQEEGYKVERPELLDRYLDCLKQLK